MTARDTSSEMIEMSTKDTMYCRIANKELMLENRLFVTEKLFAIAMSK